METILPPPTVVKITLKQIRPSPQNPRRILTQEMIDSRAANMAEAGQAAPINVRPLTLEEKAGETSPDVLYEIVDGEVRYRAALKNGNQAIDAIILQIGPDEAFRLAVAANRTNKPLWFEDYLGMERLDPHMQRKAIAALFEVDNSRVSRAMRILGCLNEASRGLVFENLKKGGGAQPISENTLFRLTDLGNPKEVPGGGPELVERALRVALALQMTEPKTRELVEGVKGGHQPEDYPVTAIHSTRSVEGAPSRRELIANQSPVGKPSAAVEGESPKAGGLTGLFSSLFHRKSLVPAGLAGVVGVFLLQNLRRALGTLARRWMIHAMVGLGIVALLSPHLFVSVSRLLHSNTGTVPAPQTVKAPTANTESEGAPAKAAHVLRHKTTKSNAAAKASVALPLRRDSGGQAPQTLSPDLSGEARPVGSVQRSQDLAAWAASDAPLAGEFANRFYGISYMNWDSAMDYFKAHMTEDESPVFIQQYFPPTLLRQFQEKRLVLFFEASKPPQLVKVEGTKDEFLAQGTVTTKSYLNRNPQTLSKKPVALMVEIWHVQGFGARVGKAAEVSPDEAKALSQNAPIVPVGNPKDSSQRDQTDQVGKIIGNAANAAATAAAGDAVSQTLKKLLPF